MLSKVQWNSLYICGGKNKSTISVKMGLNSLRFLQVIFRALCCVGDELPERCSAEQSGFKQYCSFFDEILGVSCVLHHQVLADCCCCLLAFAF